MHPTQVAARWRQQMHRFSGIFSPGFSRPQSRFIEPRLFGIAASQDGKLRQIGRALGGDISRKKTEERLSHHLAAPARGARLQRQVPTDAAGTIHRDTLRVVDPTDIRKPSAPAMPHWATVRDGSRGALGRGYGAWMALACEPSSRRVLPLRLPLGSASAPDSESENAGWLARVDAMAAAARKRGIFVMDRGGDRRRLYQPLWERGLRFIVRLVGDRHRVGRGRKRRAGDLARGVTMRYADTWVREAAGGGEESPHRIRFSQRAAAGAAGCGVDAGGDPRLRPRTVDAVDPRGSARDAPVGGGGGGGGERLFDAVAGGGNHPVHQTELPAGRQAGAGRPAAEETDGAGSGDGVLLRVVVGGAAEVIGGGAPGDGSGEAILRGAGVSR